MEFVYPKKTFFLKQKTKKTNLIVLIFIYFQLINIITGPDIVLKFLGYRYYDVNDIGFGWFTTSVNLIFILLALSVLSNNKFKSIQLISKAKNLVFILFLTFFTSLLVSRNMLDQSVNLIVLTVGCFLKICSLIILFDKHKIEFSTVLLKVLKIVMILMLLYLIIFFSNGFSTILIGRYQSFFSQPNTLGQFSSLVICALFSERLYFSKKNKSTSNNFSFMFFLLVAITFIIMSQSFTNLLLIALNLLMYFFYRTRQKILYVLFFSSVILFAFFFFTKSNDLSVLSMSIKTKGVSVVSSNFDRDLTLTGRTQIWRDVLDKVQFDNKTIYGYGLGGFWGKEKSPSSKIDNSLIAVLGQSHNGFVELFIQYGLIGLSLFGYFLLIILNKLAKIKPNLPSIIFFNFFFSLMIFNNLVEASYLQPKHFLNSIFILSIIYILNSKKSERFRKQDLLSQNIKYLKYKEQYD